MDLSRGGSSNMNSSIVSTASSTGVDELAQTGAKGTVPLNSNASKIKSVGSSEQSEDKSKCGHTDMEFFTTQEALQVERPSPCTFYML